MKFKKEKKINIKNFIFLFNLQVKTLTGKEIEIDIEPTDKVGTVTIFK